MPNHYTKFSALLPLCSAGAVTQALELLEAMRAEGADGAFESESVGFEAEANEPPDSELQHLWIHHDESGSVENVLAFVYACCEKKLTLPVRWSLIWAGDCSKPCLDAYCGGAIVLDLETGTEIASLSLTDWAYQIKHCTHQVFDVDREAAAQAHDCVMQKQNGEATSETPAMLPICTALAAAAFGQTVTISGVGPD
ncbi:hypothetical protein [Asaia sp. As-1742]|uniref:hypothetical protein n=1 Tax=Asaia sp. As-1742 TaxID=2608325 RepID=UPI0014204884|nr:hypothetical protein [Asaia sp. As-1742]NIE81399.1 hypothetical protein [Asaia sp. As-1742]